MLPAVELTMIFSTGLHGVPSLPLKKCAVLPEGERRRWIPWECLGRLGSEVPNQVDRESAFHQVFFFIGKRNFVSNTAVDVFTEMRTEARR